MATLSKSVHMVGVRRASAQHAALTCRNRGHLVCIAHKCLRRSACRIALSPGSYASRAYQVAGKGVVIRGVLFDLSDCLGSMRV